MKQGIADTRGNTRKEDEDGRDKGYVGVEGYVSVICNFKRSQTVFRRGGGYDTRDRSVTVGPFVKSLV